MTVLSEDKAKEIRATMLAGGKSRYAVIRELVNYGMLESDATDYVDKLASEIYQAPTAKERAVIREERLQRANFGTYRTQLIIGLAIVVVSLGIRFSGLELPSILGDIVTIIADYSGFIAAIGVIIFLYGLRVMLMGMSSQNR